VEDGELAAADFPLQACDLTKSFGRRGVLRGIELTLRQGHYIGLLGPNGAGKTTLLRCLASLVRPTAGRVLWFGRPAAARPCDRRLVGMVGHDTRVYPQLTLRENLLFAARMFDVADADNRVDGLLEETGLESHGRLRPSEVSRGMQQRVALARALVHAPPILLLDEPFSGLDAAGSRWLMDLLHRLRQQGQTLCFSSHDVQQTFELADNVFELQSGRLARVEDPGSRAYSESRAESQRPYPEDRLSAA